jgi:hypothetical protein
MYASLSIKISYLNPACEFFFKYKYSFAISIAGAPAYPQELI